MRGTLIRMLLLVSVALPSSMSADRICPCPQRAPGWLLYQDSNGDIPDFFSDKRVIVQEIQICEHGISFLFISEQNCNWHISALVIVRPSEEFLRERLGAWDSLTRIKKLKEQYLGRYFSLFFDLKKASNGKFRSGSRMNFLRYSEDERPAIEPPKDLILHWRGHEIPLRGYIDVYYTMIV